MEIEILDSAYATKKKKWHLILRALPQELQDIYFHPEYIGSFAHEHGSRGLMFVAQKGSDIWLYAFIIRRIFNIGGRRFQKEIFDIESAYGYGGPITNSKDRDFINSSNEAFAEWCKKNCVISEFVRFHPLIQNQKWFSPGMAISRDRDTVSIDLLTMTESGLSVDQKTRNILRRVEKSGLRVLEYSSAEGFEQFVDLYLSTMRRLDSDNYYLFNDKYFNDLRELVAAHGWLYVAELNGKWVAAAIFLRGKRLIHYHLSASDADNRIPGSTNILISHAAQRGHQLGYLRLHLGGGRTTASNDSLLIFKRKMATDVHSFFVGKRIHDSETYRALCDIWTNEYPQLSGMHGSKLLCYRYTETI